MASIYCSNCGQPVSDQSPFCPNCGAQVGQPAPQQPQQAYQQPQQAYQQPQQAYQQPQYAYGAPQTGNNNGSSDYGTSGKSRTTAGLLALLLGGFGIHYFYLGKAAGGLVCLLLSLITCGLWAILTFIQGIVIMTMKQEDFERKFVYSNSFMPLF